MPYNFTFVGETKPVPMSTGSTAQITNAQYTSPGSGPANISHWSVSNPTPTGDVNVTYKGFESNANIQLTVFIDNVRQYSVPTHVA